VTLLEYNAALGVIAAAVLFLSRWFPRGEWRQEDELG
jgi:hypothetical protein